MSIKSKSGILSRLARFSVRRRRGIMLVWLVAAFGAAPLALTLTSALSGAGWEAQGSDAQIVRDELRRDFPSAGAESAIVVFTQSEPFTSRPDALKKYVANLSTAPGVEGVIDPLSMPREAGLVARDGRTALIPVALAAKVDADRPESAGKVMNWVDEQSYEAGTTANLTGEWAVWHDFNKENEKALKKAELLSGLPMLILLFIAFGSAIAAGIPLLLAIAGIFVGWASLNLLSNIMPLSVWSMNFSMMIGLAVGVDYSLFIVSRYREEREDGKDLPDAMAGAMATAGKAVFLSALTVILSLAALFFVPVMVFRSMALGMILSVVAVSLASLTLLPAVLAALGDRVLVSKGSKDPDRAAEGRWTRWTARALHKPGRTLILGLVVLLGLGGPAIGMKLGMPGATVVDQGAQSRDGFDIVVKAFGPGAVAPIFVTTPQGDAQLIIDLAMKDPNVAQAGIVTEPSASGRVAVRIFPKTGSSDPATSDLVGRLRNDISDISSQSLVGGPGSQNRDLTGVLIGTAPLAIGLIMFVAFILLLVVFRSLTIALSSVVLNLISVGASFGFATLVFQHGYGAGLIGIENQGFINAWAPLFFFALLFGLSMDYQLFLLAAIKEQYEKSGDTQVAIREGIARTGRPITNAALIMIVVFIAFGVTGPIPPTELGITLAVAVFLDATVIRMMLVPALFGLLGDKTWWLPKWLGRILPHVNFSH